MKNETVTIPVKVLQNLIRESQETLDFAETYGHSGRASIIDWSDYLEFTQKAINAAKRAAKLNRRAA